ncbi:MAG: PEP/pyruvate-binding domain-containing protein [Bacteroidota bacterium]|nr:PEP/pyruvate-binding domain-containing protein [Bacteroidota bacterium]
MPAARHGLDEVTDVLRRFGLDGELSAVEAFRFKDLMRFRIGEILLVSSLYDYYTLVEDGQLDEAVFSEFAELNLIAPPHVTRVHSGEAALETLRAGRFDVVISMLRLGDMDLLSFCRAVKSEHPDIPVVLLAGQSRELTLFLEQEDVSLLDRVFIWTGDRKVFLAIVKLLEDIRNAPVDCLRYGVRSILLLEDSPAFYSSYLPLVYEELIRQGRSLIEEGANMTDRFLRYRARPKVLLAVSYEEAWELYTTYRETLLGVITDMTVSMKGHRSANAGLTFARNVRNEKPDLPVLVQSAETVRKGEVEAEGFIFADKTSRTLLQDVGTFIKQYFGFGDFVFRRPDGAELARARNLRELRERLKFIPVESLLYHASRDHFSNWLMARTHVALARKLKPVKVHQFQDAEELRRYLLVEISRELRREQEGVVTDFSRGEFDEDAPFTRIGGGSLGGKARGLAFVERLLHAYLPQGSYKGMRISIPRTVVLGTDVFEQFVELNALRPLINEDPSDDRILRAFLRADLPPTVLGDLRTMLRKVKYPLAIRSSSLLEDALYQPFAGIYATLMIPNSSSDFSVRFFNLAQAVKYVFASTWFRGARNYIEATGNRVEEERMAVIIQEMVGSIHERYFYPHLSGVARSFNYYPFGKAKPRDGVVNLALGLGKTIVDGGVSLQFCPAYPAVHPQFTSARDFFRNAQTMFWALNLATDIIRKEPAEEDTLAHLNIQEAERHGVLTWLASTYSAEDDRLYEGVAREGPRVLDFAPILKSRVIPLTEVIQVLVGICETAMNCPVEMEFAVRLGTKEPMPAEFSFLQVRPMVKMERASKIDLGAYSLENLLLRTKRALGNGVQQLHDVVYIKPESFDAMRTREMVRVISALNTRLSKENRPYLLIGPGRWGSSDPSLGIPVTFPDISASRAIVEASLPNMMPDPSQGSHFFQNLTSFHIMYFTVRHDAADNTIDWGWLDAAPAVEESDFVRLVRFGEPLKVIVDGTSGEGIVVKAGT